MIARLRARLERAGRERGAISALIVGLAVMLLVLAGLVVDGGNAINARAKITDDAEQAARAAANQINIEVLRATGVVTIMESEARAAAVAYLTGLDPPYDPGNIDVDVDELTNEVEVFVIDTVDTQLLTLVFINSFPVQGRATSRPAAGIVVEIL
ncbi:MAG: pilus assembly protein TadG-related protein [Jiangellaceae bacterium]